MLTSESLAAPSQWIAANLPKDAIIATRRIGAVGYYSDRRIFDYCFGLTEREVARLIARNGRPFSHPSDPALAEIWKRVSPDYILEDRPIMEEIARAAGGSPDSFVVHGLPYRLARVFPLTEQAEWLLCKKTK